MKGILFLIFFLVFGNCFSQEVTWKLYHPIKKVWLDASKQNSVQEILIQSGELPDPFYGENESKFSWIESYIWEFKTEVNITNKDINSEFVELLLPYVDTYSKIYVNDSLVLLTENAFKPYFIQIKPFIHLGKNEIRAVFTPPTLYHKQTYEKREVTYPAPNDIGEIPIAPLTRKPQYQFGWDWAFRMNTIGFMKPVSIRCYNRNKIKWRKIETKSIQENKANLTLSIQFFQSKSTSIHLKSKLFGDFPALLVTNGSVEIDVFLNNPKLWWPRGQGEPNLYCDSWIIQDLDGNFIDSTNVEFGVRTSELIQDKDANGTSYYFKINGRPIFCKGANYIPTDVFPTQITTDKVEKLIREMVESNFNIVRVWGGGIYPDDSFYKACNKYGIMVWQDLMFACAMYPGDSIFLENVKEELEFQVPRIAANPCVIQFNGNNEVDVAWKHWGFQVRYLISKSQQAIIIENYEDLFKRLAPSIIEKYTNIPYIHTSPLGHWTEKEDFPHGTQHYWGVWHGKDPIEDFGKKSGRFNAEYGFQSFPEYSTLLKFSTKSDWDLNSTVMKSHQKSYVGNGMIKKHSDLLFGKPKDFSEFVYFSQLTQAKAVSVAISAHRLNAPICMGTIFWQLNDCWPAPTWSSIDYYGNWKALQYRVKEDYEDITVLEKTEEIGREEYYFVSDSPVEFETTLTCEIYAIEGDLIEKTVNNIQVKPGLKYKILVPTYDYFSNFDYHVKFSWDNASNEKRERSFTRIIYKSKYSKANDSDYTWELTSIDTTAKKAVITINTSKFLQDLWFSSLKLGVKFNRNFISILPGKHQIEISYEGDVPKKEDFILNWR